MSTAVMEAPTETKKASSTARLSLPLKALQKALATVAPAVERKTTIPILSTVRIKQRDGEIEFAGTNLDLSITVKVATLGAMAAKPFLLPAIKTNEYAKLLSGDIVTLDVKDERATLRCGRSNTKMLSTPVVNFPQIAVAPKLQHFPVSQAVVDRLLHYVGFAISAEESRYTLNGALLEVKDGKIGLVATDGHRLARYTVPCEGEKVSVILPSAMVVAMRKTVDQDSNVPLWIEVTEEGIFASVGDDSGSVELCSRRMTGQFPNYAAVMPSKIIATFKINSTEMAAAVKRCLSFADERSGAVKLTISQEEIKMHSASTDTGETDEFVEIASASTGEDFAPFAIGFNGEYLFDAFSRLEGEVEIRFSALDGASAMLLVAQPKDGELFEYVAMPMRV